MSWSRCSYGFLISRIWILFLVLGSYLFPSTAFTQITLSNPQLLANQGQAKYLAYQLFYQMDQNLAAIGGAGSEVSTLVRQDWFLSDEFDTEPITFGQLKYLATSFYDRLNHPDVGLDTSGMLDNDSIYPWDLDTRDVTESAPVTLGQLLFVFDLDLLELAGDPGYFDDLDRDGFLDAWEIEHFGILYRNLDLDFDGDGLSDADEYGLGTHVKLEDSDGDGQLDGLDAHPSDFFNQSAPTIELVGGQGQEGAVDQYLKELLTFQVSNADGDPLLSAPVEVVISQGDGFYIWDNSLVPNPYGPIVYSDDNGQFSLYYRYGSLDFAENVLTLRGEGQDSAGDLLVTIPLGDQDGDGVLDVDELPENPLDFYDGILPTLQVASLATISYGVYSENEEQSFAIRVSDEDGNTLQNAPLLVTVVEGDGQFRALGNTQWLSEPDFIVAGNDGIARFEYRYGSYAFTQNTIRITASTLDDSTYVEVTAVRDDDDGDGLVNAEDSQPDNYYNGKPPRLSLVSESPSVATPTFFSQPPLQVQVVDGEGNPLPGAPVAILVSVGDGKLSADTDPLKILFPSLFGPTPQQLLLRADDQGILTVYLLYGSTTFPANTVYFQASDFDQRSIEAIVELALDSDGDGVPDSFEDLDGDPFDDDSNNNLIPDGWERLWGLDSSNPLADQDGDGLTDKQEYDLNLNPTSQDTDGDTLPDAWEVYFSLDPRSAVGEDGADGNPDGDSEPNKTDAHPRDDSILQPQLTISSD